MYNFILLYIRHHRHAGACSVPLSVCPMSDGLFPLVLRDPPPTCVHRIPVFAQCSPDALTGQGEQRLAPKVLKMGSSKQPQIFKSCKKIIVQAHPRTRRAKRLGLEGAKHPKNIHVLFSHIETYNYWKNKRQTKES